MADKIKLHNPIGIAGLFATPHTMEQLEDYITRFNGSDRVVAATVMGMTMNFCSVAVKHSLKLQAEDIVERVNLACQRDLEQGVSWMNDEAHQEFDNKYPEISALLKELADLED